MIWSRLGYAFRPRQFCEALGMEPVVLFHSRIFGIPLPTPVRYVVQGVHTFITLFRRHPEFVWVQTPPFALTACAWLYCTLTRAQLITDNHTSGLLDAQWRRFHVIDRFLARRALLNIAHNYRNLELLREWSGQRAMVVLSPALSRDELLPELVDLPAGIEERLGIRRLDVLMVCQFGSDDCHEQVIEAARLMPDAQFFITGEPSRIGFDTSGAPANVHFPGLLPRPVFLTLMGRCHVVLSLTTRPDALFWAIRECLALERPFVATGTEVNRYYFGDYGVFSDNTPADLVARIIEAHERQDEFIPRMRPYIEADKRRWAQDMEKLEALMSSPHSQ